MKNALFLIAAICFSFTNAYAQYYTNQNKFWPLGFGCGLNFSSGSPVPITTSIYAYEGTAALCDTAGNLLFYTNGKTVYNRLDSIMPNGNSIVSYVTTSTSQAAVIVPVIGQPNKYYIFSLENISSSTNYCKLSYSIVDMSLDSSRGDVVTTSVGISITNKLSEKMIAIPGSHSNMWLLTHRKDSAVFWAYNITASGISGPVISAVGPIDGYNRYAQGVAKCSHDLKTLVSQSCQMGTTYGTELYDFDTATGIVSNCRVLDTSFGNYGAEFSADNFKLYTMECNAVYDSAFVFQYDLALSSIPLIRASKTMIASSRASSYVTDLKLGPDSKIYLNSISDSTTHTHMDRIDSPDLAGPLCSFVHQAITLSGCNTQWGMPNVYWSVDSMSSGVTLSIEMNGVGAELFPNPSSSEFTISNMGKTYSNASVAIYDLTGRLMFRTPLAGSSSTISTSSLPSGMYVCKIDVDGNGVVSRKLVVMR